MMVKHLIDAESVDQTPSSFVLPTKRHKHKNHVQLIKVNAQGLFFSEGEIV